MSKSVLGLTVRATFGLLDGAWAWFSPEARFLMLTIAVGSTLKGLRTGLMAADPRQVMPVTLKRTEVICLLEGIR